MGLLTWFGKWVALLVLLFIILFFGSGLAIGYWMGSNDPEVSPVVTVSRPEQPEHFITYRGPPEIGIPRSEVPVAAPYKGPGDVVPVVNPFLEENEDLKSQIQELQREVETWKFASQYPEFTREGQLLRNPEYLKIEDRAIRARVFSWVSDFNLTLRPGDVDWLAERTRLYDWGRWGENSEDAVCLHFGILPR